MKTQEILVQQQLPIHGGGWCAQNGEDGVREDGRLSEVFQLRGVGAAQMLRGSGLDGLCPLRERSVSAPNFCDSISRKGVCSGQETYRRRPDARHGHPTLNTVLPFEIHRQSLGQHTHPNLAHCIRRLSAEEAAVDRRADDDNAPTCLALGEVREGGLHGAVEPFDVDTLHELEAFHGRVRYGSPPDCSGVVDEYIETAVYLWHVSILRLSIQYTPVRGGGLS